jgi:flavin-dependent dehydrogenase
MALQEFPELLNRLAGAVPCTEVRGSATVTRELSAVTRGQFALVGEASGSADAITGEGLAVSFRQAVALARALAVSDLLLYSAAHEHIRRLPQFMSRTMLLMDKNAWIRRHALRALVANPALFRQLLAVHVGELPLRKFAIPGALDLGWEMLRA